MLFFSSSDGCNCAAFCYNAAPFAGPGPQYVFSRSASMSNTSFSSLNLPQALISNLQDLGYATMTPIQAEALPAILAGKDVIARAKTGSGKTAAFGLGVLAKLDVKYFRVQTLVLCPTRELADQVASELRKLARSIHNIKILTLCGGVPIGPQIGSLEHGAHIIVGTPGRIIDHLDRGRLTLDDLTTLVLDEADRMLEMGFTADLDAVIAKAPSTRQTLLFSATYPTAIAKLSERLLTSPVTITIEAQHTTSSISQQFFQLGTNTERLAALRTLLLNYQGQSSMVFCNTKRETQDVADALHDYGFSVLALHGDMEQKDRDQTLVQFANGSACILVATDVAARGLDISSVDAVFNYQLAHDADTHIHRIGRTGRAGQSGIALSLFTSADAGKLVALEDGLGIHIAPAELPQTSAEQTPARPLMATLQLDGGKKHKIRAGDIVGALTASKQLSNDDLGKIQLHDIWSFVAIKRTKLTLALQLLQQGKIKGKSVRARTL
jgi:ATP-dependent RNA helicase DbpA